MKVSQRPRKSTTAAIWPDCGQLGTARNLNLFPGLGAPLLSASSLLRRLHCRRFFSTEQQPGSRAIADTEYLATTTGNDRPVRPIRSAWLRPIGSPGENQMGRRRCNVAMPGIRVASFSPPAAGAALSSAELQTRAPGLLPRIEARTSVGGGFSTWVRILGSAADFYSTTKPPRSYESQARAERARVHGTASHVAPASASIPNARCSGVLKASNIGVGAGVPTRANANVSLSVRCLLADGEKSVSPGADHRGIAWARTATIYTSIEQFNATVVDQGGAQLAPDNAEISTRDCEERLSPDGTNETPSRDVSNPHPFAYASTVTA